jgi:hypothetical protein
VEYVNAILIATGAVMVTSEDSADKGIKNGVIYYFLALV